MKAKINKVFDTHLHADHISAARKLAEKTNAQLYLSHYEEGYHAELRYNSTKLSDGDILMVGSVPLKVIYSPGHTIGSISLLAGGKLLFTGDTFFIDNIGRPDLFKKKEEEKDKDKEKDKVTEEFANMLHDTLHQKLFRIPEETVVFPAHYDKLVREDILVTSSLENIKKIKNLQELFGLTKGEFIKQMTSSIMMQTSFTPPNYKEIVSINEGKKPIPSQLSEIHELEIGPNRCGTF